MVMNIVDLKVFMQVIYICKFSYLEFMYQYNNYFKVTQVTYCYLGLFFCLPCSVVIVLTVKSGIHRHVPGWEKKWWTRQQFKLSLPGFSFKVLYTKLCAAGIWTMQSYCHTPPNLKLSLISKITQGFFPWQELTLSVPEVGTALNVTCWKKDQDRLYSRDQTSVFLNVLVKYYALHWAFYIVTVFDTSVTVLTITRH